MILWFTLAAIILQPTVWWVDYFVGTRFSHTLYGVAKTIGAAATAYLFFALTFDMGQMLDMLYQVMYTIMVGGKTL